MERLSLLENAQIEAMLLKMCIAAASVYATSVTNPAHIQAELAAGDALMKAEVERLVGRSLTPEACIQMSLPGTEGFSGLGLSSFQESAPIRYISSVSNSAVMQRRLLERCSTKLGHPVPLRNCTEAIALSLRYLPPDGNFTASALEEA